MRTLGSSRDIIHRSARHRGVRSKNSVDDDGLKRWIERCERGEVKIMGILRAARGDGKLSMSYNNETSMMADGSDRTEGGGSPVLSKGIVAIVVSGG